jgi:diaminopimelate epimerase
MWSVVRLPVRDDGGVGRQLTFAKGHGTENDFVLVRDVDGEHPIDAQTARWLADRHAGVGGDGVIRVVPTSAVEEVADQAADAPWFMDYRNADGGLAEMCGNGVRVFAAYLLREALVRPPSSGGPEPLGIATRSGVKWVRFEDDGTISVDLGPWRLVHEIADTGGDADVTIAGLPSPLRGLSLDLGNPHVVVALPGLAELAAADLTRAPAVEPVPPHGTNVELVTPLASGHIRMRVHERGVGETRSCGTGVAAAALATRAWAGADAPDVWRVDVPGGSLTVTALPGNRVELRGPAELVADGVVQVPDSLGGDAALPAP